MRGEANAGAGTPVDEDVAAQEFGADFFGMGHIDGDGAAAAFRIARSVDAPAALVGERDDLRGELL